MNKDAIDFGTANVTMLFRKLFFPTLFGMLGMAAMTAIDGIFIGHSVGSDGIAAVNIIIPVQMFLTGLGLMTGTGCSVVASIHLSHGKDKAARLNVTQAFIFATAVSAVPILLMLVFPDDAARLLGSSEHLLPMVREYTLWYVPSWIFIVWEAIALFIVRLDGAPKVAMASSLVASVLNIVLDWLFMFPLGWGIMGAAFATSISTVAGTLTAIVYLLGYARRLRPARLKLSRKSMALSARNIGYQCRIGSSALLGEATMGMLMLMGNLVFMHYLGDDGVGAFGIACYYTPFIFMVGNSIAQSAQPIISYNFGLGSAVRVRQAETTALATAAVCGITVTAAFTLMPEWLIGLFVSLDNGAARIAADGLPYFASGFIFFIFNVTAVGYFQSTERVVPATTFAFMRAFILLVPCFLLMPRLFGSHGIWLAMPAAEALTAVMIAAHYIKNTSGLGRLRRR